MRPTCSLSQPSQPPTLHHYRTLDFVQKTLHLGATLLETQHGQNEYAQDKRSGVLVARSAGCHATPRRADLSLHNQTISLRATPACCKFADFSPLHYQHRSVSSQYKPRYRLGAFRWASGQFGIIPKARACILESRPGIIGDEERPFAKGFI